MDNTMGNFQAPGGKPGIPQAIAAAQPDMAAQQKQLESQITPAPTPPNQQSQKQGIDLKAHVGLFGAMMLLSALSSRSTGAPYTAAMNNMTASLKGMQAGDAAVHQQQNAEMWKNYDAAMAAHKASLEKYKIDLDAMYKDAKNGPQNLYMSLLEQGYDPKLAAELSNPNTAAKLYEAKVKTQQHAQDEADKVKLWNLRLGAGYKPSEGEIQAGLAGQPWGQIVGGGIGGANKRAALIDAVTKRLAQQNNISEEEAGKILVDQQVNFLALSGAQKDIVKREVQTMFVQNRILSHGQLALELAQKFGSSTGVPYLNQKELEAKRASGDPYAPTLLTQLYLFKQELARLSAPGSNAQLHEGAREEADKILQGGFTVDQLSHIVDLLNNDAERSHQAFEKTRLEAGVVKSAAKAEGAKAPAESAPAQAPAGGSAEVPADIQELLKKHGG